MCEAAVRPTHTHTITPATVVPLNVACRLQKGVGLLTFGTLFFGIKS